MHAPGCYASVPAEKRRFVDDVLRHRLESGKVPGRVVRLVGTAAGGQLCVAGPALYSRTHSTRRRSCGISQVLTPTQRADLTKNSIGRYAGSRQGAGETPLHIAIKKQAKQSRADRLQRVDSATRARARRGGCAARALPASLKRGRDGTPDGTNLTCGCAVITAATAAFLLCRCSRPEGQIRSDPPRTKRRD